MLSRRAWLSGTFALTGALACASSSPPASPPPPPAPLDIPLPPSGDLKKSLPLVLPSGAVEAADSITPDYLRDVVATISDDRFEGRAPGSPGGKKARDWLATQLDDLGYAPAFAEGSWEQPFTLVGVTAKIPKTWSFSGAKGKRASFDWWDEFIAASGVQDERVNVRNAEVVFVGYGIVAPEEEWNDFGETDVKDKVLLMLNDDPHWDDELFAGERRLYYGRWTYKYEIAAKRGAAGCIIIHTEESAGYPWKVVQTSWDGEQFELPAGDEPRTKIHGWVTEAAAKELVGLGGHDLDELREKARSRDFEPVPLGVKTSFSFTTALRKTETANVGGVLLGSDPELAHEVVVYTAHHDHLGKKEGGDAPTARGGAKTPAGENARAVAVDRIYNGARDNGTGIAQALAVARAVAKLPKPPRRSTLVLFVGAEEQGLLGSKHYATHPTFPAEKIAANVNFELGNIWGPTEDVVIHGKGQSTLDGLLEAAASLQGRAARDEADPGSGWYYRSDQLSFARVGVPSLWFESGREFEGKPEGWGDEHVPAWIAQHYHQPSDEIGDDWDFAGMAEDAQLGFYVGAAAATADDMPAWSPDSEFAKLRK